MKPPFDLPELSPIEWPKYSTTDAVAFENTDLTFEKLAKVATEIRRKFFIYVIASDMVPDDAYGILFVREEDAKKWHKKKEDKHDPKKT